MGTHPAAALERLQLRHEFFKRKGMGKHIIRACAQDLQAMGDMNIGQQQQ